MTRYCSERRAIAQDEPLDAQSSEALREVVFSLRERNLQRTGMVFREAFAELAVPSDALKNAYELMEEYFRNAPLGAR